MAYRLDLLVETNIHLVFHVSQLKKVVGEASTSRHIPPQLSDEWEWMIEPESVFAYQTNPTTGDYEALVSWKGLPEEDATWESVREIYKQFPMFHLKDKVVVGRGGVRGNVRPPILKTYSRKDRGKGKMVIE